MVQSNDKCQASLNDSKPAIAYNLNSGVALYFSNSSSHCTWDMGGSIPATGFHSVILRPDSVKRVTPPTTMIAKTSVEDASNHKPTDLGGSIGKISESPDCDLLVEKNRFSAARVSF